MYNLHTLLGVVGERMKVFLSCTAPTTTRHKGVEGVEGVMQPLPEFPLGSTYVRYELLARYLNRQRRRGPLGVPSSDQPWSPDLGEWVHPSYQQPPWLKNP